MEQIFTIHEGESMLGRQIVLVICAIWRFRFAFGDLAGDFVRLIALLVDKANKI